MKLRTTNLTHFVQLVTLAGTLFGYTVLFSWGRWELVTPVPNGASPRFDRSGNDGCHLDGAGLSSVTSSWQYTEIEHWQLPFQMVAATLAGMMLYVGSAKTQTIHQKQTNTKTFSVSWQRTNKNKLSLLS
eukprot:GHVN01090861.1.p2 GENE.GHVN01090861.1~~GHVN01090861.1.p2  ORF type:complete len:130 (+),score=2.09 GHVN01090861.1:1456-1845(+)